MKSIINFFAHCCARTNENEPEDKPQISAEQAEKPKELLKKITFDEPDKERTPESDLTDIKETKLLKVENGRPSIILSMDGSEHHVVLFEDKTEKKKKRSKHKKRKEKKAKNSALNQ